MPNDRVATLYAHTKEGAEENEWQLLEEHLRNVADRAASFAAAFGYENWGRALGFLHDAGKVNPAFQRRLRGSGEHVDHSTPGAWEALSRYRSELGDANGRLLAFALVGHHGGIPNGVHGERTPLNSRLGKDGVGGTARGFEDYATSIDISLPGDDSLEPIPFERLALRGERDIAMSRGIFSTSVLVRMLFSCLVDADYLDTEQFVTPDVSMARKGLQRDSIATLSQKLDAYMESLQSSVTPSRVNDMRTMVLKDCRSATKWAHGIYTLTVPTGGGKTLASLSFALRHAAANNMKRVIYAIPFTSIVEQNAQVFRSVLGDNNVLEHHSNYDFDAVDNDERKLAERLAVQNWDAPLVVTTNVQLLESLFSNKPSKCRKLHNIANSVIVLDEAQMLPDNLLKVSLAMFEELAADFNVTVVLCTATQPALEGLWPFGTSPREIASHQDELLSVFGHRARFMVEGSLKEGELVEALAASKRVLCVVGTKKKARVIFEDVVSRVREEEPCDCDNLGVFHLSANMTPLHRSEILAEIRQRLTAEEQCIVISTQLIEAGVDVDFPAVYREMAGIDSLIQAAGRCNREGRLPEGIVHVFEISDEEDLGLSSKRLDRSWLGQMRGIARCIVEKHGNTLDLSMSKEFFESRYGAATDSGLDAEGLYAAMTSASLPFGNPIFGTLSFEDYADKYRIIEDVSVPVFIPWGEKGAELLDELRKACARGVPASAFISKLQRSSVGISPWRFTELEQSGAIDSTTYSPVNVLSLEHDWCQTYSNDIGLLETEEGSPMSLIC